MKVRAIRVSVLSVTLKLSQVYQQPKYIYLGRITIIIVIIIILYCVQGEMHN